MDSKQEISQTAKINENFQVPDANEIDENKKIYDEFYDSDYTKGICKLVVSPIDTLWFRSILIGFENFPQRNNPERPLIFATNHSGMAFPWDAMIFGYRINEFLNFDRNSLRALSAPMLSQSALMNPYTMPNFWKKTGAVDATFLNFETMMQFNDNNYLIYPEGVPGIGKGFNNKYKLQPMKTSFIRMSIKYKTDIITVSSVNAEYINPYTYSSLFVNKIINKIGIPFLPLGLITPFILIQPWIFYFGFPAKLTYVLGRRIKFGELTDKSYEEISTDEFAKMAKKVRKMMQEDLDNAVKKYGKNPYKLSELFGNFFRFFKLLPYGLPMSWAVTFLEYNRLYKKFKKPPETINAGFLRNYILLIKNPIIFAYFIPIVGWIPIAIKGYRKHTLGNKERPK
jgi:hypothetical protein